MNRQVSLIGAPTDIGAGSRGVDGHQATVHDSPDTCAARAD